MNDKMKSPIIYTIKEKCKTCYTCVRECPAKAISIISGQAEVIENRCIHCGNCFKVCSQNAKQIQSGITNVENLISSGDPVVAIVAPSFPAEFTELDYRNVVGAIKMLGFKYVNEVGFGADLVAKAYKDLLNTNNKVSYIATSCPAIVSYVEKYFPHLIPQLAPIVSPMIATARILRKVHDDKNNLKIVFIGPCIAKKSEILREDSKNDVNEVLSFLELRELFVKNQIIISKSNPSEFDPPLAGVGGLFAVSGGALEASEVKESLIEENVIRADGRDNFIEAIKEFNKGYLSTKLLETLSCKGCILGPGISNNVPLYERRHLVSKYVRNSLKKLDKAEWQHNIQKFEDIDLSRKFSIDEQMLTLPSEEQIKAVLASLDKLNKEDELNCGACGYDTCREHAIAILTGFAESEMCLPNSIDKLKKTITDLENSYEELKNVKKTLANREKLASMGQLSAGIAHELNNPLGVILMYSHMILEEAGNDESVKEDFKTIVNHAERCKKIVSGLLNFSRQSKLVKTSVNLSDLCKNCIEYVSIPDNIEIKLVKDTEIILIDLDKDQISQVLINLITNSMDAMEASGGLIEIITGKTNTDIYFIVKDNGPGIPEKHIKQVFDPFFTTKQIGKGTGLGLAVSYGIVKMHSGQIDVETNADVKKGATGTLVKVSLPITNTNT